MRRYDFRGLLYGVSSYMESGSFSDNFLNTSFYLETRLTFHGHQSGKTLIHLIF